MLSRVVATIGTVVLLPAAVAAAPAGSSSVQVNGVRLELVESVLQGSPEHLAQRLERTWGERNAPAVPRLQSRVVLGRQRGPFHETLTLTPGPLPGSSRMLVAVHDLRVPPAPTPRLPWPLPAAARVVNVVQFGVAGRGPTVYTIESSHAPHAAVESLWGRAKSRGWQRLDAPVVADLPGAAVWARLGRREVAVVAVPAGKRTRLVVLVTPDGGEVLR